MGAMGTPDDEQIAAIGRTLAHPLRVRVLRAYRRHQQPLSPTSLATELDLTPATLAYHVRDLHTAGMLELVDSVRRRGATELYYQLTARGAQIAELTDQLALSLARDVPEAAPPQFARADLTPLQRQLLGALLKLGGHRQPIAPSRLGEHLGRAMRGTGPALRGLEQRGLAHPLRLDPHRRWWQLTADGTRLARALAKPARGNSRTVRR
jgi:DNA-binding MarR family transcriptional regulator